MKRHFTRMAKRLTFLMITWMFMSAGAMAVEKRQIALQPPGLEKEKLSLQWWLEGLRGQSVTKAELLVDGKVSDVQIQLEPGRGQGVCYLLMVDTSQSMVSRGKSGKATKASDTRNLLQTIVAQKPAQHPLGLMTFSRQAQMLVEPTQDQTVLSDAVKKIKFNQPRTELFRFIEDGINSLGQHCAQTYRKVLILISDGISEDQSYDKMDAVKFSRDHKTSIYSFVIKDSESTQNPLYLAEKTGGWGSEPAMHGVKKRQQVVDGLYTDSNSGGELQARLKQSQLRKKIQLRIHLSSGENLSIQVPMQSVLPNRQPPAWKNKLLDWFPWLSEKQLNYVIWGLALLLLSLLGWLVYRARVTASRKTRRDPVGYLVAQGHSYPVYPGINSIGFLPTNDIIIDDETVGRAHATLHYQGEGDIVLTDLNSLNGSRVNDDPIERPTSIRDGDNITLGEWQAVFQRST